MQTLSSVFSPLNALFTLFAFYALSLTITTADVAVSTAFENDGLSMKKNTGVFILLGCFCVLLCPSKDPVRSAQFVAQVDRQSLFSKAYASLSILHSNGDYDILLRMMDVKPCACASFLFT